MGRAFRRANPAIAASLGAVLLSLGLGWYQALVSSPWSHTDERAHTGYVMSLARGALPEISSAIEVPDGAEDLEIMQELYRDLRGGSADTDLETVWVANHPPGPYLLSMPGVWLADWTGDGYHVLVWQRFMNVSAFAVAVGFTALLGREITGRGWVGALSAGLLAASPYLTQATSLAMTGGFTLACSTAVLWAATRAVRKDFDRGSTVTLAVVAAACGLTRVSALATAFVAVAGALIIVGVRERRARIKAGTVIAVPVLVLTGWFWVRNMVLYGDPAASAALLSRYGRQPRGSVLDAATDLSNLNRTWQTLAAARVDRSFIDPTMSPWSETVNAANLVLAVVVAALAVLMVPARRLPRTGRPLRAEWYGWSLLGIVVLANWLMMSQHVSGGGNPHARYMSFVVPAGAIVTGAAVARLGQRAAPIGSLLVLALVAYNLTGLEEVREFTVRAFPVHRKRLGSDGAITATQGVIALGLAVTIGSHLWYLVAARHRRESGATQPL